MKNFLLLLLGIVFLVGCSSQQPYINEDTWIGWYYQDIDDKNTWSTKFNIPDKVACLDWAETMYQENYDEYPDATYECGNKCVHYKEYDTYVCKTMVD